MSKFTQELLKISQEKQAVKEATKDINFAIGNAVHCGDKQGADELKARRNELEHERLRLQHEVRVLLDSLRAR